MFIQTVFDISFKQAVKHNVVSLCIFREKCGEKHTSSLVKTWLGKP